MIFFVFCRYVCSLAAVHDDAYKAFQTSRDLDSVIERCWRGSPKFDKPSSSPGPSSNVKITLSLMTPVLPMLVSFCMLPENVAVALQNVGA